MFVLSLMSITAPGSWIFIRRIGPEEHNGKKIIVRCNYAAKTFETEEEAETFKKKIVNGLTTGEYDNEYLTPRRMESSKVIPLEKGNDICDLFKLLTP